MKKNEIQNGQNSSIIHLQNCTNIDTIGTLSTHIYMTANSHCTCNSNKQKWQDYGTKTSLHNEMLWSWMSFPHVSEFDGRKK